MTIHKMKTKLSDSISLFFIVKLRVFTDIQYTKAVSTTKKVLGSACSFCFLFFSVMS